MRTVAALVVIAASAMASCPNLCSGHGRCGADDKCTCYRGYSESDCSARKCPYGKAWVAGSNTDPHSFTECSNKGECDRSTGMCECLEGYEGSACQRSTCPGGCSGHGVCRFVEELSTYDAMSWDSNKIQGCDCDPGYTGLDCTERLCPIGDDPMTVASSTAGQTWTIQVNFKLNTIPTVGEVHLDITSMEDGSTVSTRPINVAANTAAAIDSTLLDTGIVKGITSSSVTIVEGLFTYAFTLEDPLRLSNIRVRWETDCTVAGCQPRKQAPVPHDAITGASATVTAQPDAKAESARCSNRGICEASTGQCECYEGFYGRACQFQTVLI